MRDATRQRPDLVSIVIDWFEDSARDLPWRSPDRTPWSVLVSEVMLQQTPVVRVLPIWRQWMADWPTPADLAAASPAEVIRAWQGLGYPRRALRLRETAAVISEHHDGIVPSTYAELIALPGIGDYTACAVLSFAFGRRAVVLDTNIRRVIARQIDGDALPRTSAPTRLERELADSLVPVDDVAAAKWSAAVMELGALVCKAVVPVCDQCPVIDLCHWRALGYPAADANSRPKPQRFTGTDRQVRGKLMAVLRARPDPVPGALLREVWADQIQCQRALDSLVADGLVEPLAGDLFDLPGNR